MRSWAIPVVSLVLLALTIRAHAEKPVTVDQLEQIPAAYKDHPDEKVATELSGLRLSERASTLQITHWQSEFPGSKTRAELLRLADQSAFLDLPAGDILPTAAPAMSEQHDILLRTMDYVRHTVPTLPDFLATRATTHFEDDPAANPGTHGLVSANRAWVTSAPPPDSQEAESLHPMGTSRIRVAYRNGKEVEDSRKSVRQQMAVNGLSTSGEFGPILSVVLGDAIRSNIVWGYRQQGASGPEAVLRYHVTQDKSHYAVAFPAGGKMIEQTPAYHGEIAVDPATGAIERISAIADIAPPNQAIAAAIAVEYGPTSSAKKRTSARFGALRFPECPSCTCGNPASRSALPPIRRT